MATKAWKIANRDKMCEYRRSYYRRNKQVHIDRATRQRAEMKAWYHEFKRSLKCSKCEETHWACLEFHHSNPAEKDITICEAMTRGWSKKRILVEMAKCKVLCANCHRKEHHPE